ncbi:hypothetical protein CCP3SC15_6550001 [Gammaproteobacteria bacterium]
MSDVEDPIRFTLNQTMTALGALQRELSVLLREQDDEISAIQSSYASRVEGLRVQIAVQADGLYALAAASRERLRNVSMISRHES